MDVIKVRLAHSSAISRLSSTRLTPGLPSHVQGKSYAKLKHSLAKMKDNETIFVRSLSSFKAKVKILMMVFGTKRLILRYSWPIEN